MSALPPFETLYDTSEGEVIPLPPELAALYGPLCLPVQTERPTTLANFVTTLDGVVSLGIPGHEGGGPISGENANDHALMGLLRAVSDAVVIGAGTARAATHHLLTPAHVFPALAPAYRALREALGKPEPPLGVIVTASGEIDVSLPMVTSRAAPVLIVTTTLGALRLKREDLPSSVRVADVQCAGTIGADLILKAIEAEGPARVVLVEGGPHLFGDFLAADRLDALFLTLAPQIAGRDDPATRPGLVAGWRFAPEHPLWSTLVGVKRAGSHLFLRYAFPTKHVEDARG